MNQLLWSEVEELRTTSSLKVREHKFRQLAFRCHPDKFVHDEDKVEATRLFQELLNARDAQEGCTEELTHASAEATEHSPLCSFKQGDVVHALAFSPSGGALVACGDSGHIKVLTHRDDGSNSWSFPTSLQSSPNTILAATFLSEMLLAIAASTSIDIWCLRKHSSVASLTVNSRPLSLASSLEGRMFAAGTEGGTVCLWRIAAQDARFKHLHTLRHKFPVEGVAWGSHSDLLAVAGGGHVSLWRRLAGSWKPVGALQIGNCICTVYSVSIVGRFCAMGGTGGFAAVWSLHMQTEDTDQAATQSDFLSEDDDSTCSSSSSESLAVSNGVVEHQTVEPLQTLEFIASHSLEATVSVNAVSLSSEGAYLASGGTDCRVVLWHVASQEIVALFVHRLPSGGCGLHTATINDLQFSPDSTVVAAGGYDGKLSIWSVPRPPAIEL